MQGEIAILKSLCLTLSNTIRLNTISYALFSFWLIKAFLLVVPYEAFLLSGFFGLRPRAKSEGAPAKY